jgi:putative ABC transport system permease protein
MNRDYVVILGVAFLVGAPTGFFFVNTLIQHIYPEPQVSSPLPFLVAISVMAITVAITVGSQLKRVIRENPTTTLRSE